MFETAAIKSLERAPELVAMIIIVLAFLKYLTLQNANHAKRTDEYIASVKTINDDSNESRRESSKIIAENIKTTALNTVALSENTRAYQEFASTARHQHKQ